MGAPERPLASWGAAARSGGYDTASQSRAGERTFTVDSKYNSWTLATLRTSLSYITLLAAVMYISNAILNSNDFVLIQSSIHRLDVRVI